MVPDVFSNKGLNGKQVMQSKTLCCPRNGKVRIG
jgi:hypothetical protein